MAENCCFARQERQGRRFYSFRRNLDDELLNFADELLLMFGGFASWDGRSFGGPRWKAKSEMDDDGRIPAGRHVDDGSYEETGMARLFERRPNAGVTRLSP